MIGTVGGGAVPAEGAVVLDLLVILLAAALVAIVLQRIRLAVIPGYLITGAIVGPAALGLVSSPKRLEEISHLAIVMLMFGIGLQLHLSALRHRLLRMVLAGIGACLATVLCGIPVALAFGLTLPEAVAICMAFALSSTAVVLRILAQKRELQRIGGRLCLSILVVQDIAVLAMLAAIPALATWAGQLGTAGLDDGTILQGIGGWERLFLDQTMRCGGVLLLIVLFRAVAPRLLQESLRARSLEVLMVASLAVALSLAVAVQAMGFSLEMGAFLAGFLLAGTPFRHHLTGQIQPLRDILIAVFFTTVGMKLDLAVLAEAWWVIAAGVVLLITVKGAVIAGVCWALGAPARVGVTVGLSLAQAGEFSLVVLDLASYRGVLSGTAEQMTIAIVVVSLILTPTLMHHAPRIAGTAAGLAGAPWFRSRPLGNVRKRAPAAERRYVVVAGLGLVGRAIVDNLESLGVDVTVVELNHETVRRESRKGRSIVFGDVSSEEVLDCVELDRADALVLTMPDDDATQRACAIVRRRCKKLRILARTALVSSSRPILSAGACAVTVDEMASADAMLGLVLEKLGVDQVATTSEPAESTAKV